MSENPTEEMPNVYSIVTDDGAIVNDLILKSPVFADQSLFKTWLWLTLSFEPMDKIIVFQKGYSKIPVKLKKGELLLRYDDAARENFISVSTLKSHVRRLDKLGYIKMLNKQTHTVIQHIAKEVD